MLTDIYIFQTIQIQLRCIENTVRSNRLQLSCKTDILKNLAKLTGKHLCWSLFLNKVAGLKPAKFIKRPRHWFFPLIFAKFFRTPFLQNTYRRPLLLLTLLNGLFVRGKYWSYINKFRLLTFLLFHIFVFFLPTFIVISCTSLSMVSLHQNKTT